MKNKKVMGIIGLIVVVLLLLSLTFIYVINKKKKKEKEKIGLDLYQQVHNLYYFGSVLDYDAEVLQDNYVKLNNYYEIEKIISKDYLETANKFLRIKKIEDDYYIQRVGKGISNYYGTTLKVKESTQNKIVYIAKIKLCDPKYMVTYGDGCLEEGYYEVEKPFEIVKEDGLWKVSEYTSVFELSDSEIK